MSTYQYIRNFVKDPNIASITPTSRRGVEEVCKKMDFSKKAVIIEYGPATGVFTNYLLDRITSDSIIIAIELNRNFSTYLENNINDSRLKIHQNSAENVDHILDQYGVEADYVLSGIPFSLMDHDLRRSIVQKTNSVLRDGGKFLPYQTFYQKDHHLKDHLVDEFSSVDDNYFLRNFPPLRLYEAVK